MDDLPHKQRCMSVECVRLDQQGTLNLGTLHLLGQDTLHRVVVYTRSLRTVLLSLTSQTLAATILASRGTKHDMRTSVSMLQDPEIWEYVLRIQLPSIRIKVEVMLLVQDADEDAWHYLRPELSCFDQIATWGLVPVLQWAFDQGCRFGDDVQLAAGRAGQLDVIKWMTSVGMTITVAAVQGAIMSGCLEILDYLHTRGVAFHHACEIAAGSGQVETIEWLANHGYEFDLGCYIRAAHAGHLHVVQALCYLGVEFDRQICSKAAAAGHEEIIMWLREAGCPWDGRTCAAAAGSGRFELLRNLHAMGCPMTASTCALAAHNGYTNIMQWASEHGCPMDHRVCEAYARCGDLDMLKWARIHHAPWSTRVSTLAIVYNHPELLEWALANGCPTDPE